MKNIRFIEQIDIVSSFSFATKIAEYIKLSNFSGYDFDETPGDVTYEIYAINRPVTDLGHTLEYHELLKQEKISLPSNIVNNWGTVDEIIFDYVIETLDFKKRV
jgi:hypothetical protein